MTEVAETDEKIGIVGCKLLYPDKRIQHAGINIRCLKHIGYKQKDNKVYS